jgi:hypothetical protein
MKQIQRENTFETNSSSVHCLTLYKIDFNEEEYKEIAKMVYYNVELIDNFDYQINTTDVYEKLSYLYSVSVFLKIWPLYDELMKLFPRCVFERPSYWDNDEEVYIEDRRISSFKECANCDLDHLYFEPEDVDYIIKNVLRIIFTAHLNVRRDEQPSIDDKLELEKQIIGG